MRRENSESLWRVNAESPRRENSESLWRESSERRAVERWRGLPGVMAALVASVAFVALQATAFASPPASSSRASSGTAVAAARPLTPWRKPRVRLPKPRRLNYVALTNKGLHQAARWRRGDWYCETLGCPDRYPMLTIWGGVRMFEAVDALDIARPSAAHKALVRRFARASESYWNPSRKGYSPYPRDRSAGAELWFDDNGWLGMGFYNAYLATHEQRWLSDAKRAFSFASSQGWDAPKGGGMWWNTNHPYHSGPALAADSLLGILLYGVDHEAWQLEAVKTYVDWANANDTHDERQLYLEKENDPSTVIDYVQGPMIYAQYLLCQDGEGEAYCVHAARLAATMSEQHVNRRGYRFNYGPQYDSIYLQWMMAYGESVGDPYWMRLARVNAAAAERHAINSQGLWLNSWWGGPIIDSQTRAGMFRTVAATTSLFAWIAADSRPTRG